MHLYILQWNAVVMNCRFDNTYKMAWAKSIIELAILHDQNDASDEDVTFDFRQIAELFLKYFWNQTIYFDLVQGSNLKKIPEVLSFTKSLIAKYFAVKEIQTAERFVKIDFDKMGLIADYDYAIKRTVSTLKKDVCYRFLSLQGKEYDLYGLDKKMVLFG